MNVREWMTSDPVVVSTRTPVVKARGLMREWGFRHLLVVADDPAKTLDRVRDHIGGYPVIGIVSDRDVAIDPCELRTALRQDRVKELITDERPVEAVMSCHPHVISAGADVSDAAQLLASRQIGALPVVDDDRQVVGIITAVDCLLALAEIAPGQPIRAVAR